MRIPSACWLDPRVAVRPSPIHGLGLLATAPIAHGEIVEVLGGTVLTDAQVQAMIDRGQRYDGIGLGSDRNLAIDPSWPGVYGNQACDPNLWMRDAVTISTRRQVVPGEELTIDTPCSPRIPAGRCRVAAAARCAEASSPGVTGAEATSRHVIAATSPPS